MLLTKQKTTAMAVVFKDINNLFNSSHSNYLTSRVSKSYNILPDPFWD